MKLMAIRLIENKEPVMIIGGHRNQWGDVDLYNNIHQCEYPPLCEYINFEIDDKLFSLFWIKKLKIKTVDYYMLSECVGICDCLDKLICDVFDLNCGWKPVGINA